MGIGVFPLPTKFCTTQGDQTPANRHSVIRPNKYPETSWTQIFVRVDLSGWTADRQITFKNPEFSNSKTSHSFPGRSWVSDPYQRARMISGSAHRFPKRRLYAHGVPFRAGLQIHSRFDFRLAAGRPVEKVNRWRANGQFDPNRTIGRRGSKLQFR